MFLRFGLKERDCSLHRTGRAIPFRTKRTEPAGRADGQRSDRNAVPRHISWREIAAQQPEARPAGE